MTERPVLPPKPDAGSDLPRAVRQHAREIAASLGNMARAVNEGRTTPPGPYADDAAAAAAGVGVGEVYRKAAGVLAWRQA